MVRNTTSAVGITSALLLSGFCLFGTTFLVGCGMQNQSQPYADTMENRKKSGQLYLQYVDLMQDKKYEEAQKLIDEMAKYDPGQGPKLKGEILYAQGKYEEADKQILEALKLDSESYAYWEYAAIYAYKLGHVKEAIERASQAIAKKGLNGNPSTSYLIRAMAYHHQGQFKKAIDDLDECLKLTPENVEALYCKGAYLDEAGKPQEALKAFAEALRWAPTLQSAYKRRAVIFSRMGQKDKANSELAQAKEKLKSKLLGSSLAWIPPDLTAEQMRILVKNPKANM